MSDKPMLGMPALHSLFLYTKLRRINLSNNDNSMGLQSDFTAQRQKERNKFDRSKMRKP